MAGKSGGKGGGMPGVKEPFGDLEPWSEPAWYNTLDSPYYDDSHRALRRYVRDYLEEHVLPQSEQWERQGWVPREEVLRFARAGLAFPDIPREYRRGIELPAGIPDEKWNVFHMMVYYDETSRVQSGALAGLTGGTTIGAPPIVRWGTVEQRGKWLPGIFTGETRFALAATEPTGGSDLASLKTTARKTPDGRFYVVNGHKKWITGALSSTHLTTAVRTGGPGKDGISVLVIPTDLPGYSARKIDNSGLNAGASAWVDFENVHVPVENLIGNENEGFKVLMGNFNKERLIMAINMNRKSRQSLSIALDYAQMRHTFGKPLISHQIIRHKFVHMARYVESHFAWLEQIAYHIQRHGWDAAGLASRLAMAKIHGGRMLEMCNREAQQVLGGAGYQRGGIGGVVEQISRDLRMLVVGGGSEEILADLAMRQELAAAKKRGSML